MRTSRRTARSLRLLAVGALAAGSVLAVSSANTATASGRTAVAHHANGKKIAARGLPTAKEFRLKHGAGEPTLGITRNGYVVATISSGCVTSCAGSTEALQTVAPGGRAVFMTKDKGKTWQNVSPGDPNTGASTHVISQDPYLYVDHAGDFDRIYNIDLNLGCNEISYSDNNGALWITNPIACGEPVNDHQTVFTGKPVTSTLTPLYSKVVYYCFNKLAYTDCTKSLDGGITWIPTIGADNPECSGLNGHGVTDSRGWIYIPYAGCSNRPTLAISKDEGASWTISHVSGDPVKGGDPSVAVDKQNNLYYLWNNSERKPMISISRNAGKTWSKPVNAAAPGVKATNLATLTVGAPGKIAIAYYGTTMAPGKGAFWNGYLASATGLLTSNPTFYTATINDPKHAYKVDDCGPGRCGRVLDFIDVEIAPDGAPWGAFVDACQADCEKTKVESIHDNEGVIGTLVGGPKLNR
jgi:hypothetical protein